MPACRVSKVESSDLDREQSNYRFEASICCGLHGSWKIGRSPPIGHRVSAQFALQVEAQPAEYEMDDRLFAFWVCHAFRSGQLFRLCIWGSENVPRYLSRFALSASTHIHGQSSTSSKCTVHFVSEDTTAAWLVRCRMSDGEHIARPSRVTGLLWTQA